MSPAKKEVKEILDKLPDDSTLEEIEYEIHLRRKIKKGERDVDKDNLLSHKEVKDRADKWQ